MKSLITALISLCVMALFIEAVMSAGFLDNVLQQQQEDMTEDFGALDNDLDMMRARRGSHACLMECFACAKMVTRINPSQCVSGCQSGGKGNKGLASKTWSICSMALQRRK